MSRLILFLLALASSQAFGASYERQNEAIKQCMAADPDDHARVYLDCMHKAGMQFCSNCPAFGVLLGRDCSMEINGIDFPACWYVDGQRPETSKTVMARWRRWVTERGWLKQSAPYGPPDMEWDDKIVVKPPSVPAFHQWDPCAGSDWPGYCKRQMDYDRRGLELGREFR